MREPRRTMALLPNTRSGTYPDRQAPSEPPLSGRPPHHRHALVMYAIVLGVKSRATVTAVTVCRSAFPSSLRQLQQLRCPLGFGRPSRRYGAAMECFASARLPPGATSPSRAPCLTLLWYRHRGLQRNRARSRRCERAKVGPSNRQ